MKKIRYNKMHNRSHNAVKSLPNDDANNLIRDIFAGKVHAGDIINCDGGLSFEITPDHIVITGPDGSVKNLPLDRLARIKVNQS